MALVLAVIRLTLVFRETQSPSLQKKRKRAARSNFVNTLQTISKPQIIAFSLTTMAATETLPLGIRVFVVISRPAASSFSAAAMRLFISLSLGMTLEKLSQF